MENIQLDSVSVHAYLRSLQGVIARMAGNSASCKTWCVTLVSAILVIVADKGKPQYAYLSVIPTVFFFVLDSYYLGLEKVFRTLYEDFVARLHKGEAVASDLYLLVPRGQLEAFGAALFSFSTWPFYLVLVALILIAKALVLGGD